MLSSNLKHTATERVTDSINKVSAYVGVSLKPPVVLFNQRGKVAGSARLQTNEIRLNSVLYADNTEEFLEQVIPHEVCHIAVYQLHGRVKPHGKEWQSLMTQVFGLRPDVRHAMNTEKVQGKVFQYACGCGPVELSIRRHNNVVRNRQQYVCRKCGNTLRYTA